MEQKITDHSVRNATANHLHTITDVETKLIIEKSVMLVFASQIHPPSQHLPGNEQVTPKRNLLKCADSQHSIPINWMFTMWILI